MKVCGVYLGLLSLVALSCWHLTTGHRRLHFGHCAVSINVHEIRECFDKIRKIIQSQDEEDYIRIVEKSSLQNTRPDEQCCLFRHLLRFYIHQVFKRCSTTDHHLRWRISLIANNFLSMKKDLGFCHTHMTCRCGESSRMKYEVIQSNFEKMDPSTAVNKALGELDIFLDWIDRLE